MNHLHQPCAALGGPLNGHCPLRYVFIDEAGTSASEPVSIVVGIIVHADNQCAPAEKAVRHVLDLIPQQVRGKCPTFHAKKIWGDSSLREKWSLDDRKFLLGSMMSIPRDLNLAVAVGACRRETQLPPDALRSVTLVQAQHAIAFQECVARADSWIEKYANANEVATVIAEDVPESKRLLRHVAKWLQDVGYRIPRKDVRLVSLAPIKPLLSIDEFRIRKVSRIRMPIHFVEKKDEPLIQIADACAFGFRRFLSRQSHGQDFVRSILGHNQDAEKYPIEEWGGGIFSWSDHPGVNTFGPWRG
jgi:Protein of unknown function (DUF3800)